MRAVDALMECLKAEGVDVVFGLPGGGNLPTYDAVVGAGRPGPVLVDIPMDLSRAEIAYEPVMDVRLPGYQPKLEGNQKQIRQAAKALASAQRPVIYAGGGVVNAEASDELVEFATSD